MKQLVILSGKGGTGKTTVAAALAHLASQEISIVLADADVDAANLELVLSPTKAEEHDFSGGQVAVIDPDLCTACGICVEVCRFEAISETRRQGDKETVSPSQHRPHRLRRMRLLLLPVPGGSDSHGGANGGALVPFRYPLRAAIPCPSLRRTGKLRQAGDAGQTASAAAGIGYRSRMAHLLGLIGQNPNKLGSPGFADSHFTHQTGTIHLDGGVAVIDQAECAGCEICLQTCAEGAILSVSEPVAEKPGLPAAPPTPEVIQVRVPQPTTSPASGVTSMPWRARVLPTVGAALAYVGRELVPRIVPAVLDALERRTGQPVVPGPAACGQLAAGTGRRGGRRWRRRGRM